MKKEVNKEKIRKLFGRTVIKAGSMMLAAAVLIGSSMWYESSRIPVPELVSYVDMEEHIQVEEEAVPLVQPKVTKSVKTTKTTKKIKMNKKSKKTYSKKGATKTKTTTRKSSTTKETTTTKTEKATTVTNKFKKGSDIKTQLTTVKTTVTKTVVEKESAAKKNTSVKTTSSETQMKAGTYAVSAVAPRADKRLLNAYEKLGFKVTINPNVSYSGFFSAKDQMITLKKSDSTIYHELGHFLSFVAGNMDMSADFKNVYNAEKSKYTAYNKAYVTSSSSEYFAESYRTYVENPGELKAERPQTFAAMEDALSRVTEERVQKIWNVYSVLWNR